MEVSDDRKVYINKIPTASGNLLYLDVETSDVSFMIGDQKSDQVKIPAHKSLLAAASDVFKRMFYGPLRENDIVHITGVSVAAFTEFLQFFYIERVKLTVDNIDVVMDLGHKYNISKCSELCVEFLKDTLTDENICVGLSLAMVYDQNELKEFCKRRIVANTNAVMKSSSFLECDRTILAYILNMDLFSCSELDIFEACMAWVRASSKQNEITKELVHTHLGDLFYAIRFGSMKMRDFASLTQSHGFLFTFDEYKEIIQLIELPIFQPKFFGTNKRELPWNKDVIVLCDRTISKRPNTFVKPFKRIEATAFSTNEAILLGSLICSSLAEQRARSKQLVEVTIVEISGVDTSESDQDDDNDDDILLNEIINNNNNSTQNVGNIERTSTIFIAPRSGQNESSAMQNANIGVNRPNVLPEMPMHLPTEDDSDDEDEQQEEQNNDDLNNDNNDDDYDLIYEKRISNLKVYLRSKSRTKVLLSKPVLIRPGFLYEIRVCIQHTSYKQFYNARQLKTIVQPNTDIAIRFHPDSVHNIKKYGLIVGLEFNRI